MVAVAVVVEMVVDVWRWMGGAGGGASYLDDGRRNLVGRVRADGGLSDGEQHVPRQDDPVRHAALRHL